MTRQRVERALRAAFPDVELRLDEDVGGRLFGLVVTDRFVDVPDLQRQDEIRRALRDGGLSGSELRDVGLLLASTHDEEALFDEYPAEAD